MNFGRLMAAVWRSGMGLHEKAVLSAILTFCETSRGDLTADASLASIAERADVSDRIAWYAVADLAHWGVLSRETVRGARTRLAVSEAVVIRLGEGGVIPDRLPRKKSPPTPAPRAHLCDADPCTTCTPPLHVVHTPPAPGAQAHIGTRALRPSSDPSSDPSFPNGKERAQGADEIGQGVEEGIAPELERVTEDVKAEPDAPTKAMRPKKAATPPNPDALAVYEHWLSAMSKTGPAANLESKAATARLKQIGERLAEGYTAPQLQQAIDGCRGSDWHMSEGQTDLSLICRADKVDGFIARAVAKAGPTMRAQSVGRIEPTRPILDDERDEYQAQQQAATRERHITRFLRDHPGKSREDALRSWDRQSRRVEDAYKRAATGETVEF